MPIYEYQCDSCHGQFEFVQKFSDKPKRKCESCGGRLKKLVSASAFHLKGGGWYATDYAKPSTKSESKDTSSDAAPAACGDKPACGGGGCGDD